MKNLQVVYENCKQKLDDINVKTGIIKSVKVNSRAKKRWGKCTRKNNMFEIEISSRLMEDNVSDEATETTMLHELIHTCPYCFNHGPEWKRIADKVNKVYGYNIKRITSEEEKGFEITEPQIIKKHKVICVKCGAEIFRQKESNLTKYPWKYCCARCGGDLRREY